MIDFNPKVYRSNINVTLEEFKDGIMWRAVYNKTSDELNALPDEL